MAEAKKAADTGGHTRNGNTHRSRAWVFTINNPVGDTLDTAFASRHYGSKYVYQYERGDEGTLHVQGYIRFKNARTFAQVVPLLTFESAKPHVERCRDQEAAIAYCQKADTRVRGPYRKGCRSTKAPTDYLEGKELYPYQKEIISTCLQDPHPRKIYWYFDRLGGVGKTALARHLSLKYGATKLGGKAHDIKYGVAQASLEKDIRVLVIDVTRSSDAKYVSYQAIEAVKDAHFFSGKYEGCEVIYDIPHVFVFANFPPTKGKLSCDRWRIREIFEAEEEAEDYVFEDSREGAI